ncbi:MAG: DUF559 domain-containing protein [Ardenticatenaceae bacterium]|nr:DUF559 domain-containing protein [Ardenticatenaceae bacterium]
MPAKHVVVGQTVDPQKQQRAKELRRTMTPAEAALWQQLRGNRLNGLHFRRQQVIDGLIVDFYCHAAGVVVEVDGTVHLQQVEQDADRDAILSARGLRVIRVTNEEVLNNLPVVLHRIAEACEGRT